jgi:RNA recognition motif-containing protein
MEHSVEEGQITAQTEPSCPTHPNCFIKPVPPNWDEERLRQFFSAFGEVDSVRISAASRPGVLSHAFVRFEAVEAANAALQALQSGTLIGGVPVMVKSADADMQPRLQSGMEASPWCYCRGLPANLSRDEVAAMFAVYGPIKDIKQYVVCLA